MSVSKESIAELTIRRDSTKHAWVLLRDASHGTVLPWSDEAPAISVLLWLKTRLESRVNVIVQL